MYEYEILIWWGYWRGGVEHVDEHQTEGHQQHYSSGDHVLQCEASEIKKQLMKKYLIVLNFVVAQKETKRLRAKKYDACSAAWYLYATAFQLYTTNHFHAEHIIVRTKVTKKLFV